MLVSHTRPLLDYEAAKCGVDWSAETKHAMITKPILKRTRIVPQHCGVLAKETSLVLYVGRAAREMAGLTLNVPRNVSF